MAEEGSDQQERVTENPQESLDAIPNGTVFAYNMGENEAPGGMKVRWKIRVVTGREASRWDERQAEAFRELMQWAHRRQHPSR